MQGSTGFCPSLPVGSMAHWSHHSLGYKIPKRSGSILVYPYCARSRFQKTTSTTRHALTTFPTGNRFFLGRKMKHWVLIFFGGMLLAACQETAGTTSESKPLVEKPEVTQGTTIRNNTEFRAALKRIKAKCDAQYKSNLQGVSIMKGILGGSGGNLINQAAASSAKGSYNQCMKEYKALETLGTSKGLTVADPRPKPTTVASRPVQPSRPTTSQPPSQPTTTLWQYYRDNYKGCDNPYNETQNIGC